MKPQSSTLDQCQLFRGERKSPTLKKKSETIYEPVLICVSKQFNHLHEKQKQGTVLGVFLGKKYFMQGVDALP